MDRREFLKYSTGVWTAAASNLVIGVSAAAGTQGGCVPLSKPLIPMKDSLFAGEGLLLTHCQILDVEEGTSFPGHILIRNKLIEEVSRNSDVPRADKTIDLKGRYVMPGLINNHCHMTFPGVADFGMTFLRFLRRQVIRNAEECLRHGVTTVRDMLGHPGGIEALKKNISQGRIAGPRILRSSAVQVQGGYSAIFSIIGGAKAIRSIRSPEKARDAVKKAHDEGADFIKTFLQYTQVWLPGKPLPVLNDDELRAIRDEAEKHGLVVALHHTSVEGFRRALATGISSFEHVPVDTEMSQEDIAEFIKKGLGIVPTVSVSWSLSNRRNGDPNSNSSEVTEIIVDRKARLEKLLDEYAEEGIKRIAMTSFRKFSRPEYFDRWHLMITPEPRFFNSMAVVGRKNLLAMVKAGALIGCGNDGGTPFLFPGMMALEMSLLQRMGIAPRDILKMATINNAKILKRSDILGSIKKGMLADLVVLSDNPYNDIANVGRIEKVFFEGQLKYSTDGV